MIKIRIIKSTAARVRYHKRSKALTPEEKEGRWLGAGSRLVHLPPNVPIRDEDLKTLLDGYGPDGCYLGQQRKATRRAAWDIVVSPPKSISVAALSLADHVASKVRRAWDMAVTRFAEVIDTLAARQNLRQRPIPTGNTIIAAFTHARSRHDDPQLHTHFIVCNATFDASDQAWRSLEVAPIFRNHRALDRAFHRELYNLLREAGLAAEFDKRGRATLPQVPDEVCARLSKAHAVIEHALSKDVSLLPVRNPEWQRDLLNDRLRPAKNINPVPLKLLVLPPEQQLIEVKLNQPPSPPASPRTPSRAEAASAIQRIYRAQTLFYSPRALFSAAIETACRNLEWPLQAILTSMPSVRDRIRRPAAKRPTLEQLAANEALLRKQTADRNPQNRVPKTDSFMAVARRSVAQKLHALRLSLAKKKPRRAIVDPGVLDTKKRHLAARTIARRTQPKSNSPNRHEG